jgi:glycosyltransferase involved in cell wall biosynthesis
MNGIQAQKYHNLVERGFVENGCEVIHFSGQFVNAKIATKEFKRNTDIENNVQYIYLSFRNKGIFRKMDLFLNVRKEIKKMIKKKMIDIESTYMVCDVLNYSLCLGALSVAKKNGIKSLGIITDLPRHMLKKKGCFIKFFNSISASFFSTIIKKTDSFLFLTKYMNDINRYRKPYIVIEGQIGLIDFDTQNIKKYENKVCLYAGIIDYKYGIKNLVDAFILADVECSELHIYGDGDYKSELLEKTKSNSSVVYHGIVNNDIVVKEEMKSTLLINPRDDVEEFTKFSFPSKNLEYMASGTVTLCFKLPGIPDEYDNYLCYFPENNIDSMSKTITQILSSSKEELDLIGKRAQEFVINNKNNKIQAKKILDLLESL